MGFSAGPRIRTGLFAGAIALAVLVFPTGASAQYADLSVQPPAPLYWCYAFSFHSDAFLRELLKSCSVVETDDPTLARLKSLAGSDPLPAFIRYALKFSWNCGPTWDWKDNPVCGVSNNTMFGYNEQVPPEAYLHWAEGGCLDETCANGTQFHACWQPGDPVALWQLKHASAPYRLCDGRDRNTHLLLNPLHPKTIELSDRYVDVRKSQGYVAARVDEAWHELAYPDKMPWSKIAEITDRASYIAAWAALFERQRLRAGWITCPSIYEFQQDEAMQLAVGGGCVSSETAPGGFSRYPDWVNGGNYSTPISYGYHWRAVSATANMVRLAHAQNTPNLYWLMLCGGIGGGAITDLQKAVGQGGDLLFCNESNILRHPSYGNLAPWYK